MAQFVQSHAGIDKSLEGRAQVGVSRKMRGSPLGRIAATARVLDPGMHEVAVRGTLVEVAAAKSFVAQARDTVQQEAVSPFERAAGGDRLVTCEQRPVMPPPDVGRRRSVADNATLAGKLQLGRPPRCSEGRSGVSEAQMIFAKAGQDNDRIARVLDAMNLTQRLFEMCDCTLRITGQSLGPAEHHRRLKT